MATKTMVQVRPCQHQPFYEQAASTGEIKVAPIAAQPFASKTRKLSLHRHPLSLIAQRPLLQASGFVCYVPPSDVSRGVTAKSAYRGSFAQRRDRSSSALHFSTPTRVKKVASRRYRTRGWFSEKDLVDSLSKIERSTFAPLLPLLPTKRALPKRSYPCADYALFTVFFVRHGAPGSVYRSCVRIAYDVFLKVDCSVRHKRSLTNMYGRLYTVRSEHTLNLHRRFG